MSPVLDRPLGPPPAAPPVAQLPPPGESPPNGGAKAPKSAGPLFDGMHQVALFLLTVGAVIGFTHKFAYTQGLGVNIELGNESPAQLAVDALESLQEYWLLYGGLVLAAFALLVLIGELERRDRLPVRVGSLRAFALCAFLSAVACVSYDKGSGEARNLATLAFHSGDMSHFQEIVMPPQSASHDTASCFNWKPATAPASISSMTYDFVVAETEDRIHVVQITVSYDAMGKPDRLGRAAGRFPQEPGTLLPAGHAGQSGGRSPHRAVADPVERDAADAAARARGRGPERRGARVNPAGQPGTATA